MNEKKMAFREWECIRPVHKRYPITAEIGKKGRMWTRGYHTGTDFGTPEGTPVYCVRAGVVVLSGPGGALGKRVWVRSLDDRYGNIWHAYCHLSEIYVEAGRYIRVGQPIGKSGNTGNSTGPHLHFQTETRSGKSEARREFLKPVFL